MITKTILIIIILIIGCTAKSQNYNTLFYKNYSDSTGKYLIEYLVNVEYASVPAVHGAEPHYQALISVYQIIPCRCFENRSDTTIILNSKKGTYVENGCYEDVPEEWVKYAIKLKNKKP